MSPALAMSPALRSLFSKAGTVIGLPYRIARGFREIPR